MGRGLESESWGGKLCLILIPDLVGGDRSHWSVDASTMAVTIFTVNAFIFLHMYDLV